MKILLLGVALVLLVFIVAPAFAQGRASVAEAVERLRVGQAILIDVREPSEWTEGVARGALLLPLSDLQGSREKWKAVLDANKDKELLLYCRSGRRSDVAATLLKGEGFKTTNIGGYADWVKAGQPTDKP